MSLVITSVGENLFCWKKMLIENANGKWSFLKCNFC
jgi:hypothetical protein